MVVVDFIPPMKMTHIDQNKQPKCQKIAQLVISGLSIFICSFSFDIYGIRARIFRPSPNLILTNKVVKHDVTSVLSE